MDDENILHLRQHRDRGKILDRVERQAGAIKRRIGSVPPPRGCAERISVGRRLRDQLHADIAASSGPIFDYERLRPPLIELLSDSSGDRVDRAARLKGDYYPDGA